MKNINLKFDNILVQDVRFHASEKRARKSGQTIDPDPNYSCLYVTIETDHEEYGRKYKGYGISIMKDTRKIMKRIAESLFDEILKDCTTTKMYESLGKIWKELTTKTFEWLERDKHRYIRLAAVAIINALWDLWARIEDKPVWKLLTDMTPAELVSAIGSCNTKVLTEKKMLKMLTKKKPDRETYEKILIKNGYPTSVTGFYDKLLEGHTCQRIHDLSRNFKKLGFTMFKIFANTNYDSIIRRCETIRRMIGNKKKKKFVLNANEVWRMEDLLMFLNILEGHIYEIKPYCIDIRVRRSDIEQYIQVENMFQNIDVQNSSGKKYNNHAKFEKFMLTRHFKLPHIWQLNIGIMGLNEALLICLMAHKKNVPVWSYGDGLGLGEMGQHLQMWDFICLSQTTENRMIEFTNYQHGYFEDPVYIRNGYHMPPISPGFSTKLKIKCLSRWSYPEGTRWKHLINIKQKTKEEAINQIIENAMKEVMEYPIEVMEELIEQAEEQLIEEVIEQEMEQPIEEAIEQEMEQPIEEAMKHRNGRKQRKKKRKENEERNKKRREQQDKQKRKEKNKRKSKKRMM